MKQRTLLTIAALTAGVFQLAGCPLGVQTDIVAGGVGDSTRLGTTAQVTVLSPVTTLAIAGGTPVEVNWNVVATTNFAIVRIVFDLDQDPTNDNEIIAEPSLALSESNVLLDTTDLEAGEYFIGVILLESNAISAFDYASGKILVNQQTDFVFNSPRGNFEFDRSLDTLPLFTVDWTLTDPDSTVTVEIFLDPDTTPNGNEFPLRQSTSQTGDSFTFNLPTASFDPGEYRILALVSDGVEQIAFYAPGSIRIKSRPSGFIDLRELGTPDSPVPGAIFEGFNPRDNAGSFVTSIRDIDRDGFSDFAIVAQFGKPNFQVNVQRTGVGEVYLVYGRQTPFSGRISLNSTGVLFRGDVFVGPQESPDPIRPSRGITSFTSLSDWDRDGVRDLAFGIPFTDNAAQVILDSSGYFRSGCVVIAAGFDLRPDLGFPGGNTIELGDIGTVPHTDSDDDPACPTSFYTFYGPKAPPSPGGGGNTLFWRYYPTVAAGGLGPVKQGCRISTNDFGDQCGETISAFQFDSIIISTPNRDSSISRLTAAAPPSAPGAGVVSIYYTRRFNPGWPWRTTNAPAANALYQGVGEPAFADWLPQEGPYHFIIDDFRFDPVSLRILTPGYGVDNDNSPNPCTFDVAPDIPRADGQTTVRIFGEDAGGRLSNAKGIEDFNGDGLQDILVGYPFANGGAGACYIVPGRNRELIAGGEISVNELALPLNASSGNVRIFDGIQVVGPPGSRLGESQDSIGDFNNDGLPDIAIGSASLNDRRGGVAILYGSRDLINIVDSEIALEDIPARGLGLLFVGQDEDDLAGARVATAGDVDGDGINDLLIAAPDRDVRLDIDLDGELEIDRTDCGVVYLIYGSSKLSGTYSLKEVGTETLPGAVFIGRNSGDHLGAGIGEQGDRSTGIATAGDVNGDGRADLLLTSVTASPRDRVAAGEAYLIYGQGD